MKKYLILLLIPFAALATEPETRVSLLEAQIHEASTLTVHGNYGGKTASASPHMPGENWFFTADALWWHADEGGTDYAQLFKGDDVHNRKLNFKWNWGFRAGIGKTFDHDKWDLYLNYTWLRAENSSAASLHDGSFLTPLALPSSPASQVKVHWSFNFYTLDLNLGRHSFISPKLALHPYVGLKAAWIPQHIRTRGATLISGPLNVKQKNEFWGIGPSLGTGMKWFLDSGFYLLASGGGALLWGDFDIHHRVKSPTPGTSFGLDIHEVVPVVELQLGIGYGTYVYHNKYHIAINACYETQYFWNQNQLPYFSSIPQRFQRYSEDLSLQGITVNARFDF